MMTRMIRYRVMLIPCLLPPSPPLSSTTQVFLHNEGKKPICNIKVDVPLTDTTNTKVFSSYVYDIKAGKTGLTATPQEFAKKLPADQVCSMYFSSFRFLFLLLSSPSQFILTSPFFPFFYFYRWLTLVSSSKALPRIPSRLVKSRSLRLHSALRMPRRRTKLL